MNIELAAGACAILAYAVGAVTLFELPNGRRIAGVAAFGPSVIALGPSGLDVVPLELLVAGALGAELVASLIARRSVVMLLRHGSLLGACAVVMAIAGRLLGVDGATDRTALALAVGVSSLTYPLGDWLLWSAKRAGAGVGRRLWQDVPASVPVYFVLLSCSMLITLSYPVLGWAADGLAYSWVIERHIRDPFVYQTQIGRQFRRDQRGERGQGQGLIPQRLPPDPAAMAIQRTFWGNQDDSDGAIRHNNPWPAVVRSNV